MLCVAVIEQRGTKLVIRGVLTSGSEMFAYLEMQQGLLEGV